MDTKKTLITDIDNTLFDWFTMWHQSFYVMIKKVSEISKIPLEELYPEIKKIHQKYGTAEYAFLLEELPPLLGLYKERAALIRTLMPAIDSYRQEREKHMVLYPSVLETLRRLRELNIDVIAFSESKNYYSSFRISQLGLDGIVNTIYCPEDHPLPSDRGASEILQITKCSVLHGDFKKPNPEILLKILEDSGLQPSDVLYVGDSKSKDIKMAIDANIDFLWFESGSSHLNAREEDYDLLKKVTHWSDAEVEAEKILAMDIGKLNIPKSRIIKKYSDILDHI